MDNDKFAGFIRPTSTDTPNEFFTQVAPRVTHMTEMKVVIYTIYRTFGFRKWEDWISLSQYEHGTGHNDDHGCGLSHVGIIEGLDKAVDDGYLRCRILCPNCKNEVHKTDVLVKHWKNRHSEGVNEIPVVPEVCPHCAKPLRTLEQPNYRLAFRDDLIDEYNRPQDYLSKYNWGQVENPSFETTKLEKATYPQVAFSSTQVENSSFEPEKLEKATSQSLIRSQSPLQYQSEDDPLLSDLIDLIGLASPALDSFLSSYSQPDALQWCAYVLDPRSEIRDPPAFLAHCCLKQKQPLPPVHYAEHEIRRILAIHRVDAHRPDPESAQVVVVEPPPPIPQPEPDPEAVQIWKRCLVELEQSMTRTTFDQWIRPARALRLDEDRFTIGVSSIYAQEWLDTRLRKPIERTLSAIVGRPIAAVFYLGSNVEQPEEQLCLAI